MNRAQAKLWPGGEWRHNVYELLAPFTVPVGAVRRIVRRAHRRDASATS